jgi:membrane carboxypeptidase/penicillin-binding protein
MKEKGFITQEEFEASKEEAKTIEIKKMRTNIKAPHFVFFVKEYLEEKY